MSTTVRIRDEDKHRLETLQEELRRRTGRRSTLQRIIGALAEHGLAAPDHLALAAVPTSEDVARLRSLQGHYGRTDAGDVDAAVYE